jgi:hypothetical protein
VILKAVWVILFLTLGPGESQKFQARFFHPENLTEPGVDLIQLSPLGLRKPALNAGLGHELAVIADFVRYPSKTPKNGDEMSVEGDSLLKG